MTASTPQIVVADGHTLNPGDLDWSPLRQLGSLKVYERSGPTLVERCQAADVVLTNKEVLDAAVLAALPKLRFISVLATGTNVVDLTAAKARGIAVSNVPAYATEPVAQHVFALLLDLVGRISEHSEAVVAGRWEACADFSFTLGPIEELSGKTFGIIGLGSIGRRVAQIARALGMQVLAASSHRPGSSSSGSSNSGTSSADAAIERVELEQLLRRSDVVSLHCPLTAGTQHLINAQRLAWMKPSAVLINTGRGPLIDEAALVDALETKQIAAVGLDVLSQEPPRDNPVILWAQRSHDNARRCRLTPHIAWASVQARQRLLDVSVENVRCFLRGTPQNVVNG